MVSASSSGGLPVAYCTRRTVQNMSGFQATSIRRRQEIFREIQAASRRIEAQCHRYFYPNLTTEKFDWPGHQYETSWRIWLDERELAAVPTQVLSAGVDITDSVLPRPPEGPPYLALEINLATQAAFNSGQTYQDAIEITGSFGYTSTEVAAGSLSLDIGSTDLVVQCGDGALLDAGSTLRIDEERMLVTGTRFTATGATLSGDLAANNGAILVPVNDTSLVNYGETLLIDGERLWVSEITDQLICKRAEADSVLAAHSSGASIFAERGLTVTRGALGTTAASHTADAPIYELDVPSAIQSWCKAEVVAAMLAERTGFAAGASSSMGGGGTSGNPASYKSTIGAMLDQYRAVALNLYGRQLRFAVPDRLI